MLLVRWGVVGFAINLVTGLVFFVGEPLQYIDNPAFRFKMLFLVSPVGTFCCSM